MLIRNNSALTGQARGNGQDVAGKLGATDAAFCPPEAVDRSIPGTYVARVLYQAVRFRNVPKAIRTDRSSVRCSLKG